MPGSVTPVMRWFAEGSTGSGKTIDARYQMIGTPIDRCMSLATIAPDRAVRAIDRPVVAADD